LTGVSFCRLFSFGDYFRGFLKKFGMRSTLGNRVSNARLKGRWVWFSRALFWSVDCICLQHKLCLIRELERSRAGLVPLLFPSLILKPSHTIASCGYHYGKSSERTVQIRGACVFLQPTSSAASCPLGCPLVASSERETTSPGERKAFLTTTSDYTYFTFKHFNIHKVINVHIIFIYLDRF
jgi:hypothetical protein